MNKQQQEQSAIAKKVQTDVWRRHLQKYLFQHNMELGTPVPMNDNGRFNNWEVVNKEASIFTDPVHSLFDMTLINIDIWITCYVMLICDFIGVHYISECDQDHAVIPMMKWAPTLVIVGLLWAHKSLKKKRRKRPTWDGTKGHCRQHSIPLLLLVAFWLVG